MVTCPVCKSQNMDAAKFCGNCGTPFPRSPVPSSSLVNCSQGHIYSAVYQHCPYCPQPEQPTGDFATRVESETIVETSGLVGPAAAPPIEFATRVETPMSELTVIEAAVTSLEVDEEEESTTEDSGASATRVEPIDFTETVINQAPVVAQPPPVVSQPPPPLRAVKPPAKSPDTPPPPPAPHPVREPHTADQPDRRTVLVSSPDLPGKGKGKIVGWLISYSRNADGVDFRVRAGFNRIGAHPACDLVLEDETVSGSHAVIVFRDGRLLIKDELSRNGTFVNGVEVTEARVLQNYDQIRIGNTNLTFVSSEKPA